MSDAPSGYRVFNALIEWQQARAKLLDADPSLESDQQAIEEILGQETGTNEENLARLIRAALHARSQAEAASKMADDLKAREARFAAREKSLRASALNIMIGMEWDRRDFPDFGLSVAAGSLSVDVEDLDAIPDIYIEEVRKPDKATILSVLKSGGKVPGAELKQGGPSLRVRTR